MRYLVTARVKPGKEADLLRAIESGELGRGSVAGDEYLHNMAQARLCGGGRSENPPLPPLTRSTGCPTGGEQNSPPNGESSSGQLSEGNVRWVEVCFCDVPLDEERPYWEEFFDLVRVQDAHARHRCRDVNGTEPWACCECDCTAKLEEKMRAWGQLFLEVLRTAANRTTN